MSVDLGPQFGTATFHDHPPYDKEKVAEICWYGECSPEVSSIGEWREWRGLVMLDMYESGMSQRDIGKVFGVSRSIVWRTCQPVGSAALKRIVVSRRNKQRAANRQRVLAAKSGGCFLCGELDPTLLEFHRRDPTTKRSTVALLVCGSTGRLLEEIAKCDVLCRICHRRRHHGR